MTVPSLSPVWSPLPWNIAQSAQSYDGEWRSCQTRQNISVKSFAAHQRTPLLLCVPCAYVQQKVKCSLLSKLPNNDIHIYFGVHLNGE